MDRAERDEFETRAKLALASGYEQVDSHIFVRFSQGSGRTPLVFIRDTDLDTTVILSSRALSRIAQRWLERIQQ